MRGTKWIANLALAVALVVPAFALAAPAGAAQIRLGAYTPNSPASSSVMSEYNAMVGRSPEIVMFYKAFSAPLMTEEQWSNMKASGSTPMITWEPSQPTSGYDAADLRDITAGRYDDYIRESADLARDYSSELMIRFAHEMNISSILWGPGKDGNVGDAYVEAWRHVVTIFREAGATNVKFVWSPNVDWGGVPFNQYFPGDEWVDYVGLDGYNWGVTGTERWQSMSQLFGASYQAITALSSKPVIFAETSCGESGGSKADWIREGFLKTIPEQFPRVAAVIWFNSVAEQDWRINTSSSALQAYREVVASTLYGGTVPLAAPVPARAPQLESLTVTPASSRASGNGAAQAGAALQGSASEVSYQVSQKAPVRIEIRKRGRSKAHRAIVVKPRRHGRVKVRRLTGSNRLTPGRFVVIATVLGNESEAGASRVETDPAAQTTRRVSFVVTAPRRGTDSDAAVGSAEALS